MHRGVDVHGGDVVHAFCVTKAHTPYVDVNFRFGYSENTNIKGLKYSVELMTVDAVVSRLGITARTLHYYEEVGLLPYVGRTEGGHRIYSEETVLRLEKILRLKETLGYPLKEIRKILEAEESLDKLREEYRRTADGSGERTQVLTQFEELLRSLIERIDSRLVRLQNMRDAYNTRLEKTRGILRELREQGEEPS